MERNINCISYIYYRFGIKPIEEYRAPPSILEIYKYFEEVEGFENAEVLAASLITGESRIVFHMAALNEDKNSVTHREGYGKDVTPQSLEEFLKKYNNARFGEDFRLILLRKK